MLLFWDVSRVLCEVLEMDSQHIHLQVRCKVTQVSFLVTFVYPVYCVIERRKLCDHLTLVGSSLTLPCIVAGDFNFYSSPNDKVGGGVLHPYDTKDLMDFRMALGLEDAPFMGSFFTWTNGSIWSKLDRVLMNSVWGSLALTCSASFLPMEPVSDHCPVIISLVKTFANGTRPFKFMNMWELFGFSREVQPIDRVVVSNGYVLSTAEAGVKDDRKRSILERVGFSEGTFPVRYLGIPLAPIYFFWGGRPARVAWDDICTPKLEGGLGLMDLWKWNVSLLTRAICHLYRDIGSIWVKFVKHFYLGSTPFWDYSPRDQDSFLFKRLCTIRDQLLLHFGGVDGSIAGLYRCCVAGRFDTGLVYEALRVPHLTYPWMRIIWRPFIPPKFSFTLWLSCRKRLATRDSLSFMNLDDVTCVFCRNADETLPHLFFSCPFTSAIWSTLRSWLGIRRQMTTLESAIKWIKKEHDGMRITF
ncbi:hypothetical protein LIER_17244 [Lithospermum erythrorhizon]|uniref:Reverse transcriptase zinc-binding domain-containing protein n=1 Tax=Lithospermum erythrorhizon TaxID=34254 RepID=A0AAV3QAC9_LITER